jgi:hypothetical protein
MKLHSAMNTHFRSPTPPQEKVLVPADEALAQGFAPQLSVCLGTFELV